MAAARPTGGPSPIAAPSRRRVFPTLPGTDRRSGDEDHAVTRVYPVSQPSLRLSRKPGRCHSPACVATPPSPPGGGACGRRRHHRCRRRRLASWRGPDHPGQALVVIPLHATTAAKLSGAGAATGRATARQAGESWTYVLTVHGLKVLPGDQVYECWWAASGSTGPTQWWSVAARSSWATPGRPPSR